MRVTINNDKSIQIASEKPFYGRWYYLTAAVEDVENPEVKIHDSNILISYGGISIRASELSAMHAAWEKSKNPVSKKIKERLSKFLDELEEEEWY